jgi:hypothetical protein
MVALKPARFVHGVSQQELESLLDFERLGVEEGGEVRDDSFVGHTSGLLGGLGPVKE